MGASLLFLSLTSNEAAPLKILQHRIRPRSAELIRDAAIADRPEPSIYTWGRSLREWRLRSRTVARLAGNIGAEGGCAVGPAGVVLQEGRPLGRLTLRRAPDWRPVVLDAGVELLDCSPVTLHGVAGVLAVQRGMQVRFYETAGSPYREIYSFYTPSRQAGLLTADIDGDGLPDIYCGNYWIRSPGRAELPWRLFAINTYSEEERSATCRLSLADLDGDGVSELIVSQAEMNPARLAWFRRPTDVRELWLEHRMGDGLKLARLRGLATADFDGDGRPDIAVGEDNGARSRIFLLHNEARGRFEVQEIARGEPVVRLFAADVNGDGTADLVRAGRRAVEWWEFQRRK